MAANIDLYEDSGALLSGRGTTVALCTEWNLKASSNPAYVYYPTNETSNAPLIRPFNTAGGQTLSYKRYLSFKIDGTYSKIKNPRIYLDLAGPQTDNAQLFYKLTNSYSVPDATFDGDMTLLATDTVVQLPEIWPMLGSSPASASSRSISYGPNATLWTPFIVVQARINNNCAIGNTAEFTLRLEVHDYD
jgi:hypothetical protein